MATGFTTQQRVRSCILLETALRKPAKLMGSERVSWSERIHRLTEDVSADSAEEDSPGQITRFFQQTNCGKIEEDGVGTHRQKRRKETHQPTSVRGSYWYLNSNN